MIHGVVTKKLEPIVDERGWLAEILRSDEKLFEKFGQVYLTTVFPDVVKAWHYHRKQVDFFVCIKGIIKIALYDSRKDSPTYGEVNEFFSGDKDMLLIRVPPLVYHGFKGIGTETAYIINIPTLPYSHKKPDEYRVPPDTKDVPYDWILNNSKKNG